MKRILKLSALAFFMGIFVISGCAKKTVLKEETSPKESVATAPAKPADTPPKAALKEERKVRERTDEAPPAQKEIASQVQPPNEAKEKARKSTLAEAVAEKKPEPAAATPVNAPERTAAKEKATAVSSKELYEITDIHFDFDRFNLREEARDTLKKHAAWLSKNRDVAVVVEGHCDERGTSEYNLALGQRRADTTAKFLIDLGIDEKRIKTITYGEERPFDPGHNETAWAKNRRAHFNALGMKKSK